MKAVAFWVLVVPAVMLWLGFLGVTGGLFVFGAVALLVESLSPGSGAWPAYVEAFWSEPGPLDLALAGIGSVAWLWILWSGLRSGELFDR